MPQYLDEIKDFSADHPQHVVVHGLYIESVYDFRPGGVSLAQSWAHVADLCAIGFVPIRIGPALHFVPGQMEGRA